MSWFNSKLSDELEDIRRRLRKVENIPQAIACTRCKCWVSFVDAKQVLFTMVGYDRREDFYCLRCAPPYDSVVEYRNSANHKIEKVEYFRTNRDVPVSEDGKELKEA